MVVLVACNLYIYYENFSVLAISCFSNFGQFSKRDKKQYETLTFRRGLLYCHCPKGLTKDLKSGG